MTGTWQLVVADPEVEELAEEPDVVLELDDTDLAMLVEQFDDPLQVVGGSPSWLPVAAAGEALKRLALDLGSRPVAAAVLDAAALLAARDPDAWVLSAPILDPIPVELETRYAPEELAALFAVIDEPEHAAAVLDAFLPGEVHSSLIDVGLASLMGRGIVVDDPEDDEQTIVLEPHATIAGTLSSPAVALTLVGLVAEGTARTTVRVTDDWAVFTTVEDGDGAPDLVMSVTDASDAVAKVLDLAGLDPERESPGDGPRLKVPMIPDGEFLTLDLSEVELDIESAWSVECRWTDGVRTSGDTVDWLDAGDAGCFLVKVGTRAATLHPVSALDLAAAVVGLLPEDE